MVERSIAWLTRNNRKIRYGDPSERSLAHHSGPDPHRHQLGRRL